MLVCAITIANLTVGLILWHLWKRHWLCIPLTSFALLEKIHTFALTHNIKLIDVPLDEFLATPGMFSDQADHVVALVTDQTAHQFIDIAKTLNLSLEFCAFDSKAGRWQPGLACRKTPKQRFALALEDDPEAIDILRCNNEVVAGLGDHW